MQSADIIYGSDRSSCAALHGVRIVAHTEEHDPCSGGIGFLVSLCLSVQAIPIVHVGYLLVLFCHKPYRGKEHSHISHSSHRHTLIIYIRIQLVASHDGIVVAAVPEGDVQVAVPGINRLLLKVLSVAI